MGQSRRRNRLAHCCSVATGPGSSHAVSVNKSAVARDVTSARWASATQVGNASRPQRMRGEETAGKTPSSVAYGERGLV